MRMEDIQQATADHIRNIARTETGHRDTVDIVDDLETGMKSLLQQEEERVGTQLMPEKCRKVDSRYIPCQSVLIAL